jgi:hypothetical protein
VAAFSCGTFGFGFSPARVVDKRTTSLRSPPAVLHHKHDSDVKVRDDKSPVAVLVTNLAVAATIVATSLTATGFMPASPILAPPVANAVEISSGAFSIQTSTSSGQSLFNAEIDTRSLLTTLLKNRKAITASFERVQNAISEELKTPVWKELAKEVLQIEGDVVPDVRFLPPSDWTQTFKDLSQGKINFILNGEIVNIAVDPRFGKEEDELFIRVEGFKGVDLSGLKPTGNPIADVYSKRWEQRFSFVSGYWNTPLGVDLPDGTPVTAGPVTVGGLVFTIAATYASSYAYYTNQQAEEQEKAEALRKAAAAKKAVAAQKKNESEETS